MGPVVYLRRLRAGAAQAEARVAGQAFLLASDTKRAESTCTASKKGKKNGFRAQRSLKILVEAFFPWGGWGLQVSFLGVSPNVSPCALHDRGGCVITREWSHGRGKDCARRGLTHRDLLLLFCKRSFKRDAKFDRVGYPNILCARVARRVWCSKKRKSAALKQRAAPR